MSIYFSAVYLCMQQQANIPTGSFEIETIAKSIKRVTAMSTIFATKILPAKRDAVLATFKILLENSNHELRNAPINSKPYLITN